MVTLIGLWSHGLAAVLYAALALSQFSLRSTNRRSRQLIVAFAITSVWMAAAAILGPRHTTPLLLSSVRTFAFLSFMYAILREAQEDDRQRAVKVVYFTVAGVIGLDVTVTGLLPRFADVPLIVQTLTSTAHLLGLTIAAGCLVLVHNIYAQAAPDSRWSIRLPMMALGAMWAFDLHLNTIGYFSEAPVDDLYAIQGAILSMLVPVFALASRHNPDWKVRLSRTAAFQSISAIAIILYLLMMTSATHALELFGGQWARIGQVSLIFTMTVAALILLPSGKARAWLRVTLVKHLFQHRYDYREEWLRFTRTMSVVGEDIASIEDRVVTAIADIGEAPAALLLVSDAQYRLSPAASWNWPQARIASHADDSALARFLETSAHILEFDQVRAGVLHVHGKRIPVPDWLQADGLAWAGVPLIHNERLIGIVLLAHPFIRRPLDWEDYDLFKTAGKQAASYLAEARSHHALADAQRFDEFNRRFAFIMHDIKNLVSQLSLVARNAERHADNPEFRADMVATLQSSVKKMNELLARLSRGNAGEASVSAALALDPLIKGITDVKARVHPITRSGNAGLAAMADRARLEQAILHLVQNAIDASPAGVPVHLATSRTGGEVVIDIIDRGAGMSAQFVRTRLFQPFASTKESGFGIGAFEAQTLVTGMGGRLEVDSCEGDGSRFTIFLPAAETNSPATAERMRA